MTTVAIMPERGGTGETNYRAVAGDRQSVGRTAGEALDALTAQLGEEETGTLLVIQNLRPDHFFNVSQQQRLNTLMEQWRIARDSGNTLPADEQSELEMLTQMELQAASARAKALLDDLPQ